MNRRRTRPFQTRGLRLHLLSVPSPGPTPCRRARCRVGLIAFPGPTRVRPRVDLLGVALLGARYGVASLMVFLWLCAVFL